MRRETTNEAPAPISCRHQLHVNIPTARTIQFDEEHGLPSA
jgi:hypothetical protein